MSVPGQKPAGCCGAHPRGIPASRGAVRACGSCALCALRRTAPAALCSVVSLRLPAERSAARWGRWWGLGRQAEHTAQRVAARCRARCCHKHQRPAAAAARATPVTSQQTSGREAVQEPPTHRQRTDAQLAEASASRLRFRRAAASSSCATAARRPLSRPAAGWAAMQNRHQAVRIAYDAPNSRQSSARQRIAAPNRLP